MNRKPRTLPITDQLLALSDAVRLRIVRVLEREELAVGEVAKVVQLPQSTVSRHLKILADGGWVVKRTEGTAAYFRMVMDDLDAGHRGIWVAVRELMRSAGPSPAEIEEDNRRLASVLLERRADAQSFFGRLAGQWDDVRNELFGSRFTGSALLHLVNPEWVVADLGCGTGNASELLAPVVKRVIAVDQSEAMLDAARKRLGSAGNIDLAQGELTRLPIQTASVDAAVMVLVLHHVEKPGAAIAEMHRVLKPGGVALIVDMCEHDRGEYRHTLGHRWLGFSDKTMREELTRAGFARSRYVNLAADPLGKGPGLFASTAWRGGAMPG